MAARRCFTEVLHIVPDKPERAEWEV